MLGGSGALGSAICATLEREGASVRRTYRTREIDGIRCDLRDPAQVEKAVQQAADELGGLDALVQAAAISGDASYFQSLKGDRLQRVRTEELDELLSVNVKGTFAACRAAAPFLQKQGGNIVLLSSIDGIKPVASPIHYAASQAAIKGMCESLARELGHDNVRVNLLSLGILDRGLALKVGKELRDAYLAHSALQRLGTAEEVAEMVAFMALQNTYVTGQTIILDGGL